MQRSTTPTERCLGEGERHPKTAPMILYRETEAMPDETPRSNKWTADSPAAWGIAGCLAGGWHKGLLIGGLAYLLQWKRHQQKEPTPTESKPSIQ